MLSGFLLVTTLAVIAIDRDRRPGTLGVAFGAVLLLLPAPLRWRSSAYVATLAFAVFFTNNAAAAADQAWRGWPLSLLVIALFALTTWMESRERDDEATAHSTPSPPATPDR